MKKKKKMTRIRDDMVDLIEGYIGKVYEIKLKV